MRILERMSYNFNPITQRIEYPKEFVEEVKLIYPNWSELHLYLDQGYVEAVRFRLSEGAEEMISYSEILDSFEGKGDTKRNRLDKLHEHAIQIKKKEELFEKVLKIIKECS